MFIQCSDCSYKYIVNSADLKPDGRMVECANCNHRWFQEPLGAEEILSSSVPENPSEQPQTNEQVDKIDEKDPTTKEIKTIWDKKGWKINTFDVDPSNSYWHCVGSNTTRLSIGFRAEPLIRSAELQLHQLFERNRILWWNIINKTDQYFNYHHCYCSKNSCDKRNWQILNGKDITFPFTRIDYLMSKRPEKNLINNLSFYFKNNPLEILKNKEFMKIYDSINLNLPIIVVSTRINPDKCGLRVIYGSHVICKRIIESYKLKNYISIDNSGSVIVNDNDILNPSSDKRFGHINSCSIYIINEFDFLNLLLMNMKDNIIKNRKLNKK